VAWPIRPSFVLATGDSYIIGPISGQQARPMKAPKNDNLAILIDADNAQASPIHELLEEVSCYGTASVKRAYGDWSTPQLTKWKEELHTHAIKPVQQFSYTKGKNATDSALIIDAMDLLHTGDLNGFCLVSSDSDFTPLATRIRESGLVVYGFGERKTPQAFVAACDKFIYTDILKPPKTKDASKKPKFPSPKKKLVEAVDRAAGDDGWANLGTVGSMLVKNDPSFDSRNYGFKKLVELVQNQSYLEVRKEKPRSGGTTISVRLK
jgi:uncharacterized LabA/DUF88 family protein